MRCPWELARVVTPGSKAILTCRTEHFPEAKEGRALLNAELKASTAALSGEPPQFEVLELEKFSESQIRQVLSFKTAEETVKKIMANSELLELASRPVMIDLIIEALPEIEAGKPIDISRVYLYAVRRKMERDIKSERTFTSLADKLYFMCELSWEMLSNDTMSLNYKLFPERIRRLFGSAVQKETDLDHWHYDMMGQTMLIRNADGDYTPAHRSLLEFFVAFKFAAELGILADDFIDVVRQQTNIDWSLPPQDYTWSEYFTRECDEQGKTKLIAPLKEFIPENIESLIETIGNEEILLFSTIFAFRIDSIFSDKGSITMAVLKLIKYMAEKDLPGIAVKLILILEEAATLVSRSAEILSGNIINFILNLDYNLLKDRKLEYLKLYKSCFTNANISNCSFNNSHLINSFFNSGTRASNAQFKKASLIDINFKLEHRIDDFGWDFIEKYQMEQVIFYINDPESTFVKCNNLELNDNQTLFLLSNFNFLSREESKIWWQLKIQTSNVIHMEINEEDNILHILTLEREAININIQTGQLLPVKDKDYLLTWKNANFENVVGLDAKTAYFLRLLGAINVPDIADEYNPYEDPEIMRGKKKIN